MIGLREHCRRCLRSFFGAVYLSLMRATRLYVLITAGISWMKMRAEPVQRFNVYYLSFLSDNETRSRLKKKQCSVHTKVAVEKSKSYSGHL